MLHELGYQYLLGVLLLLEVRLEGGMRTAPSPAFHTDSHYSLGTQWMEGD